MSLPCARCLFQYRNVKRAPRSRGHSVRDAIRFIRTPDNRLEPTCQRHLDIKYHAAAQWSARTVILLDDGMDEYLIQQVQES